MVLYLCVLIVFSLHRELLKLILVDEPLSEVILSHVPLVELDCLLSSHADFAGGQSCDPVLHHHGRMLGQPWLFCPTSPGGASHVC
jgi:hypothetical protein